MTSSIETVLLATSSAAPQSSAGTSLSTKNSPSFADICAQLPTVTKGGLAAPIPSSETSQQSAGQQSLAATPSNSKSSANRKPAAPSYEQLLPIGANPISMNSIPNVPTELHEDLHLTNLGSLASSDSGGDFSIQTALTPSITATVSQNTSTSDTIPAAPAQSANPSSSYKSSGQGAGQVSLPSAPTVNSLALEGEADESQPQAEISAIPTQSAGQNNCSGPSTDDPTANSTQPLASPSNSVTPSQLQASSSGPVVTSSIATACSAPDSILRNPATSETSSIRIDGVEEEQAAGNPPASSIAFSLPALPTLRSPKDLKPPEQTASPDRKQATEHEASLRGSLNTIEQQQVGFSAQTKFVSVATGVCVRDSAPWQSTSLPRTVENTNVAVRVVSIADTKTSAGPQSKVAASQANGDAANSNAPTPIADNSPAPFSAASSSVSTKDEQSGHTENDSSDTSIRKVVVPSAGLQSLAPAVSSEIAPPSPSVQSAPVVPVQPFEIAVPATKNESRGTSNSSDSQSSPSPADLPAFPAAGPVQMAQIVSKAAQSEMRIDLNTSAFGSVEVHAVVHANDVGVLIGSERGDLRSLLANDLPGITHTLQQHELKLHDVSFHQQSFSFSSDSSAGGQPQPRSFGSKRILNPASLTEPALAEPPPTADTRSSDGRGLSILA